MSQFGSGPARAHFGKRTSGFQGGGRPKAARMSREEELSPSAMAGISEPGDEGAGVRLRYWFDSLIARALCSAHSGD